MKSKSNINNNCLNIKFRKDHEYIHNVTCDENGEYIFVACTNSIVIYRNDNNKLVFITNIKSPHDNVIIRCILCPLISEKYSIFASCSDDNTIGIWTFNKNKDIINLALQNSMFNKTICNLTARIRNTKSTIINCCFIINYENHHQLSFNTSSINLSLILSCKDGYFRIYSCQDPPNFHIWSIIQEFTCNVNNINVTSFTFLNNIQIINDQIYNSNIVAIGTHNGNIHIFGKFNLINNIDCDDNSHNNNKHSIWESLFSTSDYYHRHSFISLSSNPILDLKWCPNYCRNYEILASSHSSYYKKEFKQINNLPWIGMWRWNLTNKKQGNLNLIYSIINHTIYPTIDISWDIKGNEFMACTEYNITRFIQYDYHNHSFIDNYTSNSLIYHQHQKDPNIHIQQNLKRINNNLQENEYLFDNLIINESELSDFPIFVKSIKSI